MILVLVRLFLTSSLIFTAFEANAGEDQCKWRKYNTPRGVGSECVIVNEKVGWIKRIVKDPTANSTVIYSTKPRGKGLVKGSILYDDTGYPGTSTLEYIGRDKVVIRIKGQTPGVTLYR